MKPNLDLCALNRKVIPWVKFTATSHQCAAKGTLHQPAADGNIWDQLWNSLIHQAAGNYITHMNYVDKSDKMATAEVQVNKRMKYFLIKRQYGVEGLTCNSGTLCLQCYNGNNSTVHKVTGRLHEKEISEPPLQVHCLFCFFLINLLAVETNWWWTRTTAITRTATTKTSVIIFMMSLPFGLGKAVLFPDLLEGLAERKSIRRHTQKHLSDRLFSLCFLWKLSNCWWQRKMYVFTATLTQAMKSIFCSLICVNLFFFRKNLYKCNTPHMTDWWTIGQKWNNLHTTLQQHTEARQILTRTSFTSYKSQTTAHRVTRTVSMKCQNCRQFVCTQKWLFDLSHKSTALKILQMHIFNQKQRPLRQKVSKYSLFFSES